MSAGNVRLALLYMDWFGLLSRRAGTPDLVDMVGLADSPLIIEL